MFEIHLVETAKESLKALDKDASRKKRYKAVSSALKKLATNPFYPSLRSHEYTSLQGPNKEKVFESYAENNTPGAYRLFWYYGPGEKVITVFMITPHP